MDEKRKRGRPPAFAKEYLDMAKIVAPSTHNSRAQYQAEIILPIILPRGHIIGGMATVFATAMLQRQTKKP